MQCPFGEAAGTRLCRRLGLRWGCAHNVARLPSPAPPHPQSLLLEGHLTEAQLVAEKRLLSVQQESEARARAEAEQHTAQVAALAAQAADERRRAAALSAEVRRPAGVTLARPCSFQKEATACIRRFEPCISTR